MSVLPLVMSVSGLVPQTPAVLNASLIAAVTAVDSGYTANLPGSLIEDISSTDTYALIQCDSALVETVNSLTPYGANAFLLAQLGNVYGIDPGEPTNTSVYVVFGSSPPAPGFVIVQQFLVGDGSYQYSVQEGGILGAGGVSAPLFAVATQPGSWAVPASTVNNLATSVPSSITLTVNNPLPGSPGQAAEDETSYRSRTLQAGLAASQGMPRYLKTLLANVPGVIPRLVSPRQLSNQWEIIVGGSGDPYAIAYAIFSALQDVSSLTGSVMNVTGITKANPGVVTTGLNHNFTTGQVITITGAGGMTSINGVPLTITVITEKTFSVGVDTSGYGAYTSGGYVLPNLRNVFVSVNDYPDTYSIPIVVPPLQTVAISVLWNTTSTNFVSAANVAQLAIPALVDYVNSVAVGQPMNLFELQAAFQAAIAAILSPALLTRMVFAVSINGVGTAPSSGTGVIAGDPESYFQTDSTQITVTQG
jgi:hypothetical protein